MLRGRPHLNPNFLGNLSEKGSVNGPSPVVGKALLHFFKPHGKSSFKVSHIYNIDKELSFMAVCQAQC